MNRDDVVEMLKSGHLAGYAGEDSRHFGPCSMLAADASHVHSCLLGMPGDWQLPCQQQDSSIFMPARHACCCSTSCRPCLQMMLRAGIHPICRGWLRTTGLHSWLTNMHICWGTGDVWYPQPAPPDHPWRNMPNHAMTPHYSGTTLDAQVLLFLSLCDGSSQSHAPPSAAQHASFRLQP